MQLIYDRSPHTVYPTVAAAQAVIDKMKSIDGGPEPGDFTYTVKPDPKGSGRAIIEVFDEDGHRLGAL